MTLSFFKTNRGVFLLGGIILVLLLVITFGAARLNTASSQVKAHEAFIEDSLKAKEAYEFELGKLRLLIFNRAEMLSLVNAERQKRAIAPLAHNPYLELAAQETSDDHVERTYAGHYTPEGGVPFIREEKLGYFYQAMGENIAYMPGPGAVVPEIIEGWMNSEEGHRETILDPQYTDAGVGITFGPVTIDGDEYGYIAVMHFGRPQGL